MLNLQQVSTFNFRLIEFNRLEQKKIRLKEISKFNFTFKN